MLNSGLISINELDNQIDRKKLVNYPNLPYNRQAATNKLDEAHYMNPNDVERGNYHENMIFPENKPYTYPNPANKPISNNHIATNEAYTATPSNDDEVMYEKYKSMIRSRLPAKNLAYRPYERLTASPNYAYNVSGNHHHENEIAPYNYPSNYRSNQLNSHPTNHESYPPVFNNSHPNDYLSYPPNPSKEETPLFFSKYNSPEPNPINNKPPLVNDENDPDLYNPDGAVRYEIKRYLGRNIKNRRYFKPHSKLAYPAPGNYEVIRPNRFNNGLINAKEDNYLDRKPNNNRLNLIEHNYLHNYATSASNPTINKFKYNLKSLLPKMDKSGALPYGGINIDALENEKGKLSVQKIYIKDTLHHQKNPREIRELKYNPNADRHENLIQLEALSRQGNEGQFENEIPYQSNKTKVIFTRPDFNIFNQTNQLRQIDVPVSLQEASTPYGSRIDSGKNLTNHFQKNYSNIPSNNSSTTLSNKRGYKIKKMFVNRGALMNRLNETEAEENRFKFIHVPSSIVETRKLKKQTNQDDYRDEYKNEINNLRDKDDTLDLSSNTIDQNKQANKNAKYEDNLIELANQKQIVKVFPLGRVALNDNLNTESSDRQLSTELLTSTTKHPSSSNNSLKVNLTNHSSSSSSPTLTTALN